MALIVSGGLALDPGLGDPPSGDLRNASLRYTVYRRKGGLKDQGQESLVEAGYARFAKCF